jgi:hypothetical protein
VKAPTYRLKQVLYEPYKQLQFTEKNIHHYI